MEHTSALKGAMGQVDELNELFGAVGVRTIAEFYVHVGSGLDYIDECERRELAILGVEAFERTPGRLQPRLDLIGDFSTLFEQSDSARTARVLAYEEARRFVVLAGEDSSLWLNFVVREMNG